jgi:hypothetical protein
MNTGGDPPAATTVVVGSVGIILALAVTLLAQVLFYNAQRIEEQTKLYAGKPQELADLQAKQLAQINVYRHVDRQQGIVAIPIDRAIELYAAEMKSAPTSSTMPSTDRAQSDTPSSGPAP